MTRDDLRLLCTALGFATVLLHDTSARNQTSRATSIASLIESFCLVTAPYALKDCGGTEEDADGHKTIDRLIDGCKAELQANQFSVLPQNRQSLLQFYDRLLIRKMRRDQSDFLASASNDVIADQILRLIEDELRHDEETAYS